MCHQNPSAMDVPSATPHEFGWEELVAFIQYLFQTHQRWTFHNRNDCGVRYTVSQITNLYGFSFQMLEEPYGAEPPTKTVYTMWYHPNQVVADKSVLEMWPAQLRIVTDNKSEHAVHVARAEPEKWEERFAWLQAELAKRI